MKSLSATALLLGACGLLTSTALGQSSDATATNNLPGSVVAARRQYATADEMCASQAKTAQSSGAGKTVAQIPRRFPAVGPRRPPRPMVAYPMPEPSLRHAAIGGLIGFVLGATHSNTAPKDRVGLGLVVGAVGAAIGAAIPSFHGRHSNPRGPWPDDDAEEMGSNNGSAPPSAVQQHSDGPELSQTAEPHQEAHLQGSTALPANATP